MTASLLVVAFCLLGAAMAADLAFGTKSRWSPPLPYLLAATANGFLLATGVIAMSSAKHQEVSLGRFFGVGHTLLVLDGLSGMFLVITSAVALCTSMCFVSWSRGAGRSVGRGLAGGYALLAASVPAVILAGDAFSFLFAWELLSVSFYILIVHTRRSVERVERGWLALSTAKVSGAALLLGFLILAGHSGSLTLSSWHAVGPGAARDVAWLLIVVGFAAKIGIAPFSVWMPAAYPSAPGPARAALAAVGMNVGVYGLWRFLGILGHPPELLAAGVLLAGGATALGGIAFAAVQSDLLRTIAYSSVENAGIIFTAYGVALVGAASGNDMLVAAGLLAATLQALSHALAKAGMFIAAGNLETIGASTRLDDLSGLARRLPWNAAALAASALTLAGLPPSIGFVSEWFVLEALMQQFRVQNLALRLVLAGAGAMVALTAGLAALTFARVVGFTVLSSSDRDVRDWTPDKHASQRRMPEGLFGRLGVSVLGAACLAGAALAPLVVRFIASGLDPVVRTRIVDGALLSPFVLQPVFRNFSILSPSWLWIALGSFLAATFTAVILFSRGSFLRVRKVAPWRSASLTQRSPASYSSFAYVNPMRPVLANLLQSRRGVQEAPAIPAVFDPGEAEALGFDPSAVQPWATSATASTFVDDASVELESAHAERYHTRYSHTVSDPVESYLYRPLRTLWLFAAHQARKLQSGKLTWYIAYMLAALMALLAAVAGIH